MLLSFLFSIPAYMAQALLLVLPSSSGFPQQWLDGIATIWSYVNIFSFIVPVQMLVLCLGIAMTFHIVILGFKLFHWFITKIPFIGS